MSVRAKEKMIAVERPRERYHHGDLRAALIAAAMKIITEKRVEEFSVADAARAAGVSSGAPYRHFKDRDDLLAHVAAAGFEELAARTAAASAAHPKGSIDSVIASGCAYVDFVSGRPELFHLMWGAQRPNMANDVACATCSRCHDGFIAELTEVMKAQGLGNLDPAEFGAPLWAMVHGFASLLIGQNEKLNLDSEALHQTIAVATRAYFAGRAAGRGAAGR